MNNNQDSLRRREFLRVAGLGTAGALGVMAAGCTTVAPAAPAAASPAAAAAQPAPPAQSVEPRIDRVLANGVLRLGVDLTFPPLQFRDAATNEPMGLLPEIDARMAQDLGVELEYVEMPFGELIAGLQADKFDWIGIAFTATPARALQVLFIDEPTFFEDSVLILRKGLEINDPQELNSPDVTISNLSGSAQDASARLIFPNATFKPLGFPETLLEVAGGQSDASLIAIWNAAQFLAENPDSVSVWPGGSLFSDVNTYYVPEGDYKTQNWLGTFFRYYRAQQWIQNRFNYWMSQLPGYNILINAFGTMTQNQ
jgi:polar amino acid transport system substrate-binding protein